MRTNPEKQVPSNLDDDAPLLGKVFPFLWHGAAAASAAGFLLLIMPWEQPREVGTPMLLIGLGVWFLCLVCEVLINQAYWKPKRKATRERLTELAGRQHGPRQVTSTRVSLVEGAEGKIRTEVRKEVRKRV